MSNHRPSKRTRRPRASGYGNSITRAIWLHLLPLGGRDHPPLDVYNALRRQIPELTRAHTATMLARMAVAGYLVRHESTITVRKRYTYSVDGTCLTPYGLSLDDILTAASAARITASADTRILHITHTPAPAPTAAQLAAALGEDTIRRIREEFNQPHTER